jgi:hypothetical protein
MPLSSAVIKEKFIMSDKPNGKLNMKNKLLLLLVLLSCGPLLGAGSQRTMVLNSSGDDVSLSYDPHTRWAPNDTVCGFEENRKVFCGMITQISSQKLDVHMDQKEGSLSRGMWLTLRPLSRAVAAQTTEELVEQTNSETKTHDIALGMSAGINYFFPEAHLQLALGRAFSIGIEPVYVSYSDTQTNVSAYGGFLTAAYYITHFPFRGFYAEGGVGLYSITASQVGQVSTKTTQPAASLTLNWRGRASWELGLDIGVGVGIQYVVPAPGALTQAFSGVLPLFQVCLGFPF